MRKQKQEDILTDEEVLARGATKGIEKINKLDLRPLTVRTLSQMKRNGALDDEGCDIFQKTAAFGFLHSASRERISEVVNDKAKFLEAVDEWMDENFKHHHDMEPLAEAMNAAFEEYAAAMTNGGHPYKGDGSKN
jgi:hypothetical protein